MPIFVKNVIVEKVMLRDYQMKKFLACCLVWLFPFSAFAEEGPASFGKMAGDMVQGPLTLVMNFMDDACYIAGIVFLLVGFNKYLRYRDNPQETPISTPIVYFVLGAVVVLLPLIYYLVQAANQ